MARQHIASAIEALVSIIRDCDSAAARVSAANALLDRAVGKTPRAPDKAGARNQEDETTLHVVVKGTDADL
ncbi:MAG: hypothetical protein ACFB6R_07450 [Alphaproteobacteria bacterium]